MEGVVQGVYDLLGVAATLHACDVQAVALGVVADREREGERVFDGDGIAADVGFSPYATECLRCLLLGRGLRA